MAGASVALIEPDPFTQQGLARLLEDNGFRIWGTHDDINALCAVDEMDDQPALILIDGAVFDACCPERRAQMRTRFQDSRVVLRAQQIDELRLLQCYEAGVDAYVLKTMTGESLMAALTMVLNGERVYPGCLMDRLMRTHRSEGLYASARLPADVNLSERESQILTALVGGLSNKAIARRLEITEPTVKVHLQKLLKKLNVGNRTQAAIWAVKMEAAGWPERDEAVEPDRLDTLRAAPGGAADPTAPVAQTAGNDRDA